MSLLQNTSVVLTSFSMSSSLVLMLTLFTLVVFLLSLKPKNWKSLKQIPGPPKLPFLGNTLQLYVENYELLNIFRQWFKQYGKRIFISTGFISRVFLSDRYDVEKILTSQTHINKSVDYDLMEPWIGQGLLTNRSNEKWSVRRKMLTPAFHFKILDSFVRIFNEQSEVLIQNLENLSVSQTTFDIFPYITKCTLDIISETAMGIKINAQGEGAHEEEPEYVKSIYTMNRLTIRRSLSPWLQPDFIWKLSPSGRQEKECLKVLHGLTNKIIRERKAELSQKKLNQNGKIEPKEDENDVFTKGKKRLAFLDLLLEEQAKETNEKSPSFLSDQDIRDEVDTFMFAGHDTTTANIAWTLYLLGLYPDAQAKVQAELDSIFGHEERDITSDDFSRMKYLECCIKETLRLYPSVPYFARNLKSSLQLDSELTIPAGTSVFVMTFFLHRDPEVFPDPESFIPERFFPENSNGRHPFAFTPFSAGPRNCIGQKFAMMEIKSTVSQFLRKYNVRSMVKREDMLLNIDTILRPTNGIPLKICPRDAEFI